MQLAQEQAVLPAKPDTKSIIILAAPNPAMEQAERPPGAGTVSRVSRAEVAVRPGIQVRAHVSNARSKNSLRQQIAAPAIAAQEQVL